MLQNDDETGEQIETTLRGESESFIYDDSSRQASYTTNAELLGELFKLEADTIDVIFYEDAQTLDRIVAIGNVTLELDSRRAVGEALTYFDAAGRYEMSGDPVRIVEELNGDVVESDVVDSDVSDSSASSAPQCRETTGRTMTFYVTAEAVSVDGQSVVRTESTNGDCPSVP